MPTKPPPDLWPQDANGKEWDGTDLMVQLAEKKNPFLSSVSPAYRLDPQKLLSAVQCYFRCSVVQVPKVTYGANHLGFCMKLTDGREFVVRISRINFSAVVPHAVDSFQKIFDPGYAYRESVRDELLQEQKLEHRFEIAAYDVLHHLGAPFDCRPVFHLEPRQADEPNCANFGRRLSIFKKTEGVRFGYVEWHVLDQEQKVWERNCKGVTSIIPVQPTREFCVELLQAKIEATLGVQSQRVEGKRVGVKPILQEARDYLLQLTPLVLPKKTRRLRESDLYRFVLDHGDYGMHNMTIAKDEKDQPRITSVYDWEGGNVVPAIFSEPKMVTTVDLVVDRIGEPCISRWGDGDSPRKMAEYRGWAKEYYKALFSAAPEYERVIKAGQDARHIWFSLRDIKGCRRDERLFNLGKWAKQRVQELDK